MQTATRITTLLIFMAPLLLCAPELASGSPHPGEQEPLNAGAHGSDQVTDPIVLQELAALRRATAHFHRLDNATASGWDTQLTGCIEISTGGMGVHFGNMAFLLDGEANLLEPDVLVYEPQPSGKLRLVAIEYIAPLPPEAEPGAAPQLFGRDLHWNASLHAWTLHVWAWKNNPDGIFEHWNPKVSCEFAE